MYVTNLKIIGLFLFSFGVLFGEAKTNNVSHDTLLLEYEELLSYDPLDYKTIEKWSLLKKKTTSDFLIKTLKKTESVQLQVVLLSIATERKIKQIKPRAVELLKSKNEHVLRSLLTYFSINGDDSDAGKILAIVDDENLRHIGMIELIASSLSILLSEEKAIVQLNNLSRKTNDKSCKELIKKRINLLRFIKKAVDRDELMINMLVDGDDIIEAKLASAYIRKMSKRDSILRRLRNRYESTKRNSKKSLIYERKIIILSTINQLGGKLSNNEKKLISVD